MSFTRQSKIKKFIQKSVIFLVAFLLVFVQCPIPSHAQYRGGSYGGDEESMITGSSYTGGTQQGSFGANSSSAGSLSHGSASKLLFSISPSTTKHSRPFDRQPVVLFQAAS